MIQGRFARLRRPLLALLAACSLLLSLTAGTGFADSAPVTGPESYVTYENTPMYIAAPGVLGNDYDPDSDTLTAELFQYAPHGSLTLNPDGSFFFIPNQDYYGYNSFWYRALDSTGLYSPPREVIITVVPVNNQPWGNGDTYTASEDVPLTVPAPGVLVNDTDMDGDPLIAQPYTAPAHGSLVLAHSGSFTYIPDTNYCGADSFTYLADDGMWQSSPTTVSLTVQCVNDPPEAHPDSYVLQEDTVALSALSVLANDFDWDSDPLTASVVSGPAYGTLNLNPDGTFTYTPIANFNGTDSFVYRASEGALDAEATVTLTVQPVNDAPVAAPDAFSTPKAVALTITPAQLLGNDADLDGDQLTVTLVSVPAQGTLVKQADGSYKYTPAKSFTGIDSFTYVATDGQDTAEPVIVTINVLRK